MKSAKEKIVEMASQLFYAHGISAVGIDKIIRESKVAKMSFYYHFPSKKDLVLEFLQRRDSAWREWFCKEIEKRDSSDPLVIFDIMESRFKQNDFRGCAFINSMVEVADIEDPIHIAAREHKMKVVDLINAHLKKCNIVDSKKELSLQLMLLIDGAIVAAVRDGNANSAKMAKKIASALLAPSL